MYYKKGDKIKLTKKIIKTEQGKRYYYSKGKECEFISYTGGKNPECAYIKFNNNIFVLSNKDYK